MPDNVLLGEKMFLSNCQGCHNTTVSHYLSAERWTEMIHYMAEGAGLDSTQTQRVVDYVDWKLQRTDSSHVVPINGMNQW